MFASSKQSHGLSHLESSPIVSLWMQQDITPVSGIPEHQHNQLSAEMGFLSLCVEIDCEEVRDRCYEEHFQRYISILEDYMILLYSQYFFRKRPLYFCKLCGVPAHSPKQITQYPDFQLYLYFAVQTGVPFVTTLALNNIYQLTFCGRERGWLNNRL